MPARRGSTGWRALPSLFDNLRGDLGATTWTKYDASPRAAHRIATQRFAPRRRAPQRNESHRHGFTGSAREPVIIPAAAWPSRARARSSICADARGEGLLNAVDTPWRHDLWQDRPRDKGSHRSHRWDRSRGVAEELTWLWSSDVSVVAKLAFNPIGEMGSITSHERTQLEELAIHKIARWFGALCRYRLAERHGLSGDRGDRVGWFIF